jgi:hypothetical protein
MTAGAFLGWTSLFISATSTQRAPMLSTLAWRDGREFAESALQNPRGAWAKAACRPRAFLSFQVLQTKTRAELRRHIRRLNP